MKFHRCPAFMLLALLSLSARRPLTALFFTTSFFVVAQATAASAAAVTRAEEKRTFDIPVTQAPQALKKFSTQSGQQVLYSNRELAGITTNEVKGEFTQEDALKRLLAGTPLVATRDRRNGAVAVTREIPDPKG